MNFYKHYMGDYQRDTMRLSMMEDGAYRRLLDEYYATETPLPADAEECYRAARATTAAERAAVDKVLERYFPLNGDGFRHNKKADELIEKASAQAQANRITAEAREAARKEHDDTTNRGTNRRTNRQPNQTPDSRQNNNQNQNQKKRGRSRGTARLISDDFPLTDDLIAYAAKRRVASRRIVEQFHEHFIQRCQAGNSKTGKPYLYADYGKAWRNWFDRALKSGDIRPDPKTVASDT